MGGGGGGGEAADGKKNMEERTEHSALARPSSPKRARAGLADSSSGAGSGAAVHCDQEVDPSLRAGVGVVGALAPAAPLGVQPAGGRALDFPALLAGRLSDLTDDLLLLIFQQPNLGSLSVLRTTAMSKRFKDLWRSSRVVNICQYDFRAIGEDWTPIQRQLFVQFASSLLDDESGEIDTFRLNMSGGDTNFGDFVDRGLQLRPLFIDIAAQFIKPVLKLGSANCTSRLTAIRLFGVLLTKEFEHHLMANCPVLVELTIEGCKCLFKSINSSSLKIFAAIANPRTKFSSSFNLLIIAPCLQSLWLVLPCDQLCNHMVDINDDKTLRSLARVRIELLMEKDTNITASAQEIEAKATFIKSIKSLTSKLVSVTHLTLCRFSNSVLMQELDQPFIMLEKLTGLSLSYCDVGLELQALSRVIRNFPNLERLWLNMCKFLEPPQNDEANGQNNKVDRNNLKSVKVNYEDEASINTVYLKIATLIFHEASQSGWMVQKNVKSKSFVFSRIE